MLDIVVVFLLTFQDELNELCNEVADQLKMGREAVQKGLELLKSSVRILSGRHKVSVFLMTI